jgi:hypothetical protein
MATRAPRLPARATAPPRRAGRPAPSRQQAAVTMPLTETHPPPQAASLPARKRASPSAQS